MHTDMTVTIGDDENALARLLTLIRRRGFRVERMEANATGCCGMTVRFRTWSVRPADVLARQIENLVDVRAVRIESCTAAAVA